MIAHSNFIWLMSLSDCFPCFGSSDRRDRGRTFSNIQASTADEAVIFFPDENLPCKFEDKCRYGDKCRFTHKVTSLKRLMQRLATAKSTLDVCVFTITCDQLAQELLNAHQRGVKVRIITDDEQSKTLGSDIQKFRDAGIQVRDDRSPFHMHHKFAIIDQSILINGSFNWTRQAVLHNKENVVITNSGYLVTEFLQQFNSMWKEFS